MSCREFADFMMDYLSANVPPDVRTRFEDHLAACVNCQRYLASYEATVTLGQRAFDDEAAPVPADVPDELVRAIIAARRTDVP